MFWRDRLLHASPWDERTLKYQIKSPATENDDRQANDQIKKHVHFANCPVRPVRVQDLGYWVMHQIEAVREGPKNHHRPANEQPVKGTPWSAGMRIANPGNRKPGKEVGRVNRPVLRGRIPASCQAENRETTSNNRQSSDFGWFEG